MDKIIAYALYAAQRGGKHRDSKTLRGEFRQFPVERLLRFLVALNQDVEIAVKPIVLEARDNAPALRVS